MKTPSNRILKEWLYYYHEIAKFLNSIAKETGQISPMIVLLMTHIMGLQLEEKRYLTRQEVLSCPNIPSKYYYNILKKIIILDLLLYDRNNQTYWFNHSLPNHLLLEDIYHNDSLPVYVKYELVKEHA